MMKMLKKILIYAELMCVTDTWDATSDPDLYFSYNDPFVV